MDLVIDGFAIKIVVFKSISKLPLKFTFITKLVQGIFTPKTLKIFRLRQAVPDEIFWIQLYAQKFGSARFGLQKLEVCFTSGFAKISTS
jgi:hypothetical protein